MHRNVRNATTEMLIRYEYVSRLIVFLVDSATLWLQKLNSDY